MFSWLKGSEPELEVVPESIEFPIALSRETKLDNWTFVGALDAEGAPIAGGYFEKSKIKHGEPIDLFADDDGAEKVVTLKGEKSGRRAGYTVLAPNGATAGKIICAWDLHAVPQMFLYDPAGAQIGEMRTENSWKRLLSMNPVSSGLLALFPKSEILQPRYFFDIGGKPALAVQPVADASVDASLLGGLQLTAPMGGAIVQKLERFEPHDERLVLSALIVMMAHQQSAHHAISGAISTAFSGLGRLVR